MTRPDAERRAADAECRSWAWPQFGALAPGAGRALGRTGPWRRGPSGTRKKESPAERGQVLREEAPTRG